ncbi:unnamed protein product [Discosporangium mesarthrocarpum]
MGERPRRRLHVASATEVISPNIAPWVSRGFLMRLILLLQRTSRRAGLLRMALTVTVSLLWFTLVNVGPTSIIVVSGITLLMITLNWRAVLPRREWEDPRVTGINCLPCHSRLNNYTTFESAADRGPSPNVISLSGTWKFHLAPGPERSPPGFERTAFNDGRWDEITVPGHWQLQDCGRSDPPIYTNTNYPFNNSPPYVPRENPTGCFRRTFTLPQHWLCSPEGEESIGVDGWPQGCVEGESKKYTLVGCVSLVFHGVDSAFHCWVNGIKIGYGQGSRLPVEFDITEALQGQEGEHCLAVRGVRWSAGSYLEDQDHWWLSGIYRDVELVLRPAPIRICDFIVRPFLVLGTGGRYTKASLEVEILLEHDATLKRACTVTVNPADGHNQGRDRARSGGGGGPAAVRDHCSLSSSGGSSADPGSNISCMLLDSATGAIIPLAPMGELTDWQLGEPPSSSRGKWGSNSRSGFTSTSTLGAEWEAVSRRRSAHLFTMDVPGEARVWSAEDPQLYTLVIGLELGFGAGMNNGRRNGGGGRRCVQTMQYESAMVGFRCVKIERGVLHINGEVVMLSGVNRHEHDPQRGKAVTEESMRQDIVMMKRFNFNAVRNCHYPNHWRWYELCDELGLYVCDEANIETHGQWPMCRLSADPAWRTAYLERVWQMVANNKNHSSIILWSLGNESGDGANLLACRRLIKEREPSRPVVYEGGGSLLEGCGCTNLTDIVCPMYASPEMTEVLGSDGVGGVGENRPVILCEYSHAMGNSNGNLHTYWEVFRKHRRLQGGFIWDWVDQGLVRRDGLTGQEYWAYGGGFGDKHCKGYEMFCLNGLNFPDRRPHPAMWEAKHLMQPVGLEAETPRRASLRAGEGVARVSGLSLQATAPIGESSLLSPHVSSHPCRLEEGMGPGPGMARVPWGEGHVDFGAEVGGELPLRTRLLVTNRYSFLSLEHLSATWTLKSSIGLAAGGGTVVSSGPLALPHVAPGEWCEVMVEHQAATAVTSAVAAAVHDGTVLGGLRAAVEVFLHVEFTLWQEQPWGEAGHVVAWGSFPLGCVAVGGPQAPSNDEGDKRLGKTLLSGDGRGVMPAVQDEEANILEVVYDEDTTDDQTTNRDNFPMGNLREHLLISESREDTSSPSSCLSRYLTVRGVTPSYQSNLHLHDGGGDRGEREWVLVVDRTEGSIQRFVSGNVDLLEPGAGPSHCFSRAATDNDRAGYPTLLKFILPSRLVAGLSSIMPLHRLSHLRRWQQFGLSASDSPNIHTKSVQLTRATNQECTITVLSQCMCRHTPILLLKTTYSVGVAGNLQITAVVEPARTRLPSSLSLARVGMEFKLPAGFGRTEWFGRGPFECYQDRKDGASVDLYSGSVGNQHVPYLHPCENGNKADVRWVALRRGVGGRGLLIVAQPGIPFEGMSCSYYSSRELELAQRVIDLPHRDVDNDHPVFVHVDHRSMGVGGDNTWYPNVVRQEYTVPATRVHTYSLSLVPLLPGQEPAATSLVVQARGFAKPSREHDMGEAGKLRNV